MSYDEKHQAQAKLDPLVQAGIEETTKSSRWDIRAGLRDLYVNRRMYAMAFSAGTGGLAFGWDTGLIGGVLTEASFKRSFGLEGATRAKALADLQSQIVSCLQAGCFFGAALGLYFPDRFGRRTTLIVASIIFLIGSVIQTTCTLGGQSTSSALGQLYAGRAIGGFGVGLSSAVVSNYISECAPRHLRGRMGGVYQLLNVSGIALSFWINYGLTVNYPNGKSPDTKATWQIAFALQCLPGTMLLVLMILNPESPRWLLARDRRHDAEMALSRLHMLPPTHPKVQGLVDEIQADLDSLPRQSKRELFRELGNNRITLYRTVGIQFIMMMFQQLTGVNSVNYYSPQIFAGLGLNAQTASLAATGYYGIVKICTTLAALMFAVEQIGRKYSLLIGGAGQVVTLFIIGAIIKVDPPVAGATNPSPAQYASIVMIYLYVSFYGLGFSGTIWSLSAEVAPNHMRGIAVAVAAMTQWFFNWMIAFTFPRMRIAMDGYGVFFLFASFTTLGCLFVAFFLPEPQGLPIEAMHYAYQGNIIKRSLDDLSFKKRKAFLAHVLAEYGGTADVQIANKATAEASPEDVERALAAKHQRFEQTHGHHGHAIEEQDNHGINSKSSSDDAAGKHVNALYKTRTASPE